jgi:hypothetical protein
MENSHRGMSHARLSATGNVWISLVFVGLSALELALTWTWKPLTGQRSPVDTLTIVGLVAAIVIVGQFFVAFKAFGERFILGLVLVGLITGFLSTVTPSAVLSLIVGPLRICELVLWIVGLFLSLAMFVSSVRNRRSSQNS